MKNIKWLLLIAVVMLLGATVGAMLKSSRYQYEQAPAHAQVPEAPRVCSPALKSLIGGDICG